MTKIIIGLCVAGKMLQDVKQTSLCRLCKYVDLCGMQWRVTMFISAPTPTLPRQHYTAAELPSMSIWQQNILGPLTSKWWDRGISIYYCEFYLMVGPLRSYLLYFRQNNNGRLPRTNANICYGNTALKCILKCLRTYRPIKLQTQILNNVTWYVDTVQH